MAGRCSRLRFVSIFGDKVTRRIIIIILGIFFIFSWVAFSASAQNPFISKKDEGKEEKEKKVEQVFRFPPFGQRFIAKIATVQRDLYRRMSKLGLEIHEGKNRWAYGLLALIAFFYGVIHALGPGHGKTITFSYFLTENRAFLKGILFGVLIAFTQVIMALVVVLTIYFALQRAFLASFESFSRVIRLVSAGLIAGLGIWLLLSSLGYVPGFHGHRDTEKEETGSVSFLLVALSIGIIPCPGAVILILFTINLGILNTGIWLALIMALGMMVTISSVGILTSVAKDLLSRTLQGKHLSELFQQWAQRAGGFLIIVVGFFILLGNI
jgi:nickel/cobalt exporter